MAGEPERAGGSADAALPAAAAPLPLISRKPDREEVPVSSAFGVTVVMRDKPRRLGQSQVIQTNNARSLPRSRKRCGAPLRAILS